MKGLVLKGINYVKRHKIKKPFEGTFRPLFTKQLKNGWYYQIDLTHDSRCYNISKKGHCGVTVHGFKPPKVFFAKSADYLLTEFYL